MLLSVLFEKRGISYDYSAVLCNLPSSISKLIQKWGFENITDENLYIEDGKYGREDDTHITIKYGLHDSKETDVVNIMKRQRPFEVELGKISLFQTHDKYDVVKVEVFSSNLFMLNAKLNKLPNSDEYADMYKPHVTIAYVQKGSCDNLSDCNDFKDIRFLADELIFSSKDDFKVKITLQ